MSHLLSAELSATCNALGYYDSKSQKYYADTNTLETVKDLIRYLRRDDETYEIRRSLGDSQVLQTDLLPLLKGYWEQTNLFDVLLRLLVNLTSPALMLWHEVVPTEKTARYYYIKIDEHQQKYKQAFADEKIWAILSTRLSKILEIDFAIRGEENNLIIERILILVRNILYTANPDAEKRPDSDASVHDQVLWSLHQSGMLDIILFIASSTSEQAYYMHIVEILSFMLREQSATSLATTELQRSQSEKMREEAELLLMRHHENNKRQEKIRKFAGARHSRFGGTYVIKSLQSISEKNYVYHKPLNNLDSVHFDVEKKKTRTPKNRLPLQEAPTERRSAFGVKLILKEFCTEFLNGAYNTFMYYVKFNFERSKAQAHDESYYLWAMRFFMEFNRGNNFQVKLVSETISVKAFHFVQQQMENYYDYICVNKKECRSWSKRLHIALLAYRELLLTLYAMDRSRDEAVRKSAKAIKTTIFYIVEYRELIITLLLTFDEILFSRLYLNDLMETQHIFLKMLQAYCGKNELVVQKKKKRRTKKKKVSNQESVAEVEPNLEDLWNDAAPQLSALLSENSADIPDGIVPFDAASDTPISEQKTDAMKKIHQYLKDAEFENALGLLRASREVWPENDCFGSSNMAPEEELMALQDIFFANIGGSSKKQSAAVENDEEEEYSDNEEEMEGMLEPEESNFKFDDFLKRFANQRVIQTCAYALQNFEWNSVYTNYCIIKLLHRIVWDLKMVGMVFQASIFRTFQKAYTLKDLPQFKEIITFATYVLRQFFKLTEKNPKVFMETLFWKSSRDAFDIEEGYGSYHEQTKAEAQAWNETQEMELTQLFNEHQEKEIREDVVDWILNNLVDNTRSRRAVMKKLKSMSLLSNYKKSGASRSNVWTEEDEQQLREAYEASKEDDNPIESISSRLLTQRPKTKIVAKLLEMNLIQNKNEVVKGKNRMRMSKNEDQSNNSDVSEDSDSSADESAAPKVTNKRQPTTQKPSTRTKQKTKRKPQVHVSKEKLVELLRKVVHMTDALEWLHESLSDILEDRKDSNEEVDEDIPLVAIMDYSTTAIEDKDFQNLLRGLQIREPADEQESHWRILGNLSSSVLEEYCQLLSDAIANNLPEASGSHEIPNAHSDSEEEDVFDRVRKITSNNTASEVVEVLPSASTSALEDPVISETKDSENVQSDSDDDVLDRANGIRRDSEDSKSSKHISFCDGDDEGDEHTQHKKVNKKRYIIDSDEDEEKNENKRERNASDTDSPLKNKKRSRFVLSDEDSS